MSSKEYPVQKIRMPDGVNQQFFDL